MKTWSFWGDRVHLILDSICNLWNLETLDMGNSEIKCLQKGKWKLQKLRHLYLDGPTYLPKTDNKAGLPNLQVLTGIDLNEDTESLFAKARFPNVRKLRLHSSNWRESKLLSSLHPLRHLQTLKIYEILHLSSPLSFQLSLTKITLERTDLLQAMKVLCSLTNLRMLEVVGGVHQNPSFVLKAVFVNLKSLKWQMWMFYNGLCRKVQCQVFNVWSWPVANFL